MGERKPDGAKCATSVNRCRVGAIAVLLLDMFFLAAFLAPAKARQPEIPYPPVSTSGLEPLTFRFDVVDANSAASRAFYPYSVIPGGAQTPGELRNAVANDSVVRSHYADFVVANTHLERLEKTQAFYVSYRIGNSIFWTKNPLTVRAGEAILTDGANMARTRCGNRLSAVPLAPISNLEPTPETMESAAPAVLLASIDTPAELPIVPPPTTAIAQPPVPASGIFLPFLPIFPVGSGGGSLPPGTPGKPGSPAAPPPEGPPPPPIPPLGPPPPGPPPIATPEPSARLLLAAGLSCILLLKKLRSRTSHRPPRLMRGEVDRGALFALCAFFSQAHSMLRHRQISHGRSQTLTPELFR
jgi:hypothetical protein